MATRILLDTHVWLWMNGCVERLSAQARETLADAQNDLLLSVASVWEIGIKHALGKLELPSRPESYVPDRLTKNRITPIAIFPRHALRAAALPEHHRDPFDRMIVAQAQQEGLRLMTSDRQLEPYDVDVLRAS